MPNLAEKLELKSPTQTLVPIPNARPVVVKSATQVGVHVVPCGMVTPAHLAARWARAE